MRSPFGRRCGSSARSGWCLTGAGSTCLVEVEVIGGVQVGAEEVDTAEELSVRMTVIDAWCDDSACGVSHRIIYCVRGV